MMLWNDLTESICDFAILRFCDLLIVPYIDTELNIAERSLFVLYFFLKNFGNRCVN